MPSYLQTLTLPKWLSDTHILIGMRGDNLQALDRAIANYCALRTVPSQCLAATDQLKKAFESWVLHKIQQAGQGLWHPGMFQDARKNRVWQGDRRNHQGAMTRLYECLYTDAEVAAAAATQLENLLESEREAIAYMQACAGKLGAKLFAGKTCELRVMGKRAAVTITRPGDTLGPGDLQIRAALDRLSGAPRSTAAGLWRSGQAHWYANQERWRARATGAREAGAHMADTAENVDQALLGGARDFASQAASGERVGMWLRDLLLSLLPAQAEDAVIRLFINVNRYTIEKLLEGLVPVFGPIASSLRGGEALRTAVRQTWSARAIENAPFAKSVSAMAAIDGIVRLMREEAANQRKVGLRQLGSSLTRLIVDSVPGAQGAGIALGLASSVAELGIMFIEFVDALEQRDALNAYLLNLPDPDSVQGPVSMMQINLDMFRRYPLLGAYWVLIAETSTVIGLIPEDLTASNFLQQVEEISRTHLAELRSAAAELVAKSPLVIPALSSHRLIAQAREATPHSTLWRRVADSIKDSFHAWTIYRRAVRVFPAPAWKDRLVGLSSEEYAAQQAAIVTVSTAAAPPPTMRARA